MHLKIVSIHAEILFSNTTEIPWIYFFNLYLYCINKAIYPLFISIKDGWRISIVYRPCDNGMYGAFCIVYRPCDNGMYVAFCIVYRPCDNGMSVAFCIVYRPCDNGMYVAFCIVYWPCDNGMYVAFCKTSVALKIYGPSRY